MRKGVFKEALVLIVVAVLVSSSLFATGTQETAQSSQEQTGLHANIEYWSSWSATEYQALVLEKASKDFMKENPGVKINFTFNGRDNRYLVTSAMQTGTKIDVMDANADNIKALWSEYITDLTPYYSKKYPTTGGKPFVDCLLPSMTKLSLDMFDNKYMYVPYIPQAFMIFCNKGIFEDCGIKSYPKTWDEFMADCEIIKQHGYIPITSDDRYNTSWFAYYITRLIGDAKVLELAKNPSAWSNPKVLEAAKAIETMAKKGYFDPNIGSNTYPNGQQSMVINGKIAMCINGTWLPNEVFATTPDGFKWGAFAYPSVPGGVDDQKAGCYGSYGIAVNKNSSQAEKDAAFAFAAYVTTAYDQAFADEAHIVPVNVNSTWPDNLKEARDVLFNYTTRYPAQSSLNLNATSKQIILDACQKLMAGTLSAEDFVKQASKF